jgi:AbiU2
MAEESAEQVRKRHLRDMGPKLGAVYHALWNEVAWLHAKWDLYRQLYARSPERIAFLNKVASHFIGVLQDTLYDDVLLHLSRLTDPPSSGKYDRLSLQALPERVPEVALASEVKGLIQAAKKACETARSSRNRRIAHTDLALALAGTFDPIPSRSEIEAALNAVRAVLHRLEAHYWQSETGYQHFCPKGGDADSLVRYLLKGFRAEERRMERFREGKPLPEDLEPEFEI